MTKKDLATLIEHIDKGDRSNTFSLSMQIKNKGRKHNTIALLCHPHFSHKEKDIQDSQTAMP